ncbi:MAG: hypothetical protein CL824_03515 [Crocinitomicaceae bacterium]|nr:hypothetical protein [Crocinitomicaceae bacterium]|tara:strand:+ start:417 stop:1379 length:963 start_codon:yes stop_codon:yes gene_type:complete
MINNKLLILGVGSIGNRYFNILKNNKKFVIKTFDKKLKLKPNFVNFTQIKSWQAKSALICLPTYLHTSYIIKLIFMGYKYILVEKPISNNLKNLKKIKKLISEYNVKLFVVTNIRYHPGIRFLKSNIHLVGKVMFAKAYFNNNQKNMYGKRLLDHYSLNHKYGGGVLFDACHEIDYLKFLFGPIKKSYSETFMNKQQTSTQIFHSIMIHKKKVISFINNNFLSSVKKRGCEITGTKGILKWSSVGKPGNENINIIFISKNKTVKKIFNCKKFNHNEPYIKQIDQFELMKKRKKYNMSSFDDSLDTLSIILNTKVYGIKKI